MIYHTWYTNLLITYVYFIIEFVRLYFKCWIRRKNYVINIIINNNNNNNWNQVFKFKYSFHFIQILLISSYYSPFYRTLVFLLICSINTNTCQCHVVKRAIETFKNIIMKTFVKKKKNNRTRYVYFFQIKAFTFTK